MATSVEEWLAEGNEITREREPDIVRVGAFEFEQIGTGLPPRTYRCRHTGVLAHQRTTNNKVTPYVCRQNGCGKHGKHQGYGSSTWCDEHEPNRRNR